MPPDIDAELLEVRALAQDLANRPDWSSLLLLAPRLRAAEPGEHSALVSTITDYGCTGRIRCSSQCVESSASKVVR